MYAAGSGLFPHLVVSGYPRISVALNGKMGYLVAFHCHDIVESPQPHTMLESWNCKDLI